MFSLPNAFVMQSIPLSLVSNQPSYISSYWEVLDEMISCHSCLGFSLLFLLGILKETDLSGA